MCQSLDFGNKAGTYPLGEDGGGRPALVFVDLGGDGGGEVGVRGAHVRVFSGACGVLRMYFLEDADSQTRVLLLIRGGDRAHVWVCENTHTSQRNCGRGGV